MTGGATGPHLHYEVLLSNKQVNPMTVKFPTSRKLNGTELAKFQTTRQQTDRKFASLAISSDVAMIESDAETTVRK